MDTVIQPSSGIHLDIPLPGDKSIAHRAAILASMAEGTSLLYNFPFSDDCLSTLHCLEQLGIPIRQEKENTVLIEGRGKFGFQKSGEPLHCGNSGTTARLLAGVLAAQPFDTVLTGDASLSRRPMNRVAEPLKLMGAGIELSSGNYLPMRITGGPLKGITYTLPLPSAQVKSAILLAALMADRPTTLIEPIPTRNHTEQLIPGIRVTHQRNQHIIRIQPHIELKPLHLSLPGDISTAAFFIAAGLLIPDSVVTLRRISCNPTRIALIHFLRSAGAPIYLTHRYRDKEPYADILIRTWKKPFLLPDIDPTMVPGLIDEIPILVIIGAHAQNGLTVKDARELRYKESDRIAAIVSNLRAMGITCEEWDNSFRIFPGQLKGAQILSYHDHRIAMAFSIAALTAEGESVIRNSDCVSVSFPDFYTFFRTKHFF